MIKQVKDYQNFIFIILDLGISFDKLISSSLQNFGQKSIKKIQNLTKIYERCIVMKLEYFYFESKWTFF